MIGVIEAQKIRLQALIGAGKPRRPASRINQSFGDSLWSAPRFPARAQPVHMLHYVTAHHAAPSFSPCLNQEGDTGAEDGHRHAMST